jgi:hypothetical protein
MVPKDYYLILGVSRSESPSGIRARYRDLVRASRRRGRSDLVLRAVEPEEIRIESEWL